MVDGIKSAKARLVAKAFQDPELQGGLVDTSGCVSDLPAISLSARKKWKLWSLDIKHAFLKRDALRRNVFLRAPPEWEPSDFRRFWELNAPAYGLNDDPVAFRRTLQKYLLNNDQSLKAVGLLYKVSSFGPCLYFIFDKTNAAVGVFTTHIDDIWGCGLHGVLDRTRKF